MIALDTSVLVAAFASWHEAHRSAVFCLAREPRLPAHVLLETFAVLTRLPPPHRAPADLVAAFLKQRFTAAPLTLPGTAQVSILEQISASGLTGGAIYDALIGATARHAGATLITRDLRAARAYGVVGAKYEYLEKQRLLPRGIHVYGGLFRSARRRRRLPAMRGREVDHEDLRLHEKGGQGPASAWPYLREDHDRGLGKSGRSDRDVVRRCELREETSCPGSFSRMATMAEASMTTETPAFP